MSDIFLSYKSEDRPRAKIIAEALERYRYKVWWDRIILPGKTFDGVITEALDSAKCVIVLWSKKSVLSDWVKEEADKGKKRRILIPILIDDVEMPIGFGRIQAARLIDWDGTSDHEEFDLLLGSIAGILGQPPAAKIEDKKPPIESERILKDTEEKKTYINSIGMEFVLIPAGEFDMGSASDEVGRFDNSTECPVHHVKISNAFYMGKYTVTQKQWCDVMGTSPSKFKGDNLPVEMVSWKDVQDFIKKLNDKESANKYRLPTEAEWEYAARAGATTRYSFGDDESTLGEYAWYAENSGSRPRLEGDDLSENKWNGKTHSVGQKKPNSWGLNDMHGNVWEWVQDRYHDSYNDAPADGSAWENGSCAERVVRGGDFCTFAWGCRSACRPGIDPSIHGVNFGFRLMRDL